MNTAKLCLKDHILVIVLVLSLTVSLHVSVSLIWIANAQTTPEVKITGFAFVPQNLTINLGDTIIWNNTDPVIHTLWFTHVTNGSTYLLSDPIPPGATWNYTFNDNVELQYYSFDKLWVTGFINIAAGVHDVAVTNIVTSKTGCLPLETIGQGYPVEVNVTVENQGDFIETFNVTIYANTTTIEELQVTLNPGENRTLTFTWDTTGWTKGNYTINATAETVPGETDIADNSLTYGLILVTIAGDVDGDRDVDIFDIVRMAGVYGVSKPDPRYDSNADIDGDGDIDIFDIVAAAGNYGKSW